MQNEKILLGFATPERGALGRLYVEPDEFFRFPFQRDRDRIVGTQAFRRLQGKTQVFVTGQNDHCRTRLTHTLDVAGISRNIARFLGLNEDLCECIALAHDLGHPPFGHMGESALNTWMQRHGEHFEHNEQSLRLVTVLETHSTLYPGLNLNQEILLGLQKHGSHPLSLEAQLVNLADEIAYIAHDCEDGMDQTLFSVDDLTAIPFLRDLHKSCARRGTSLRGAIITACVKDLCRSSTIDQIVFSPSLRSVLDTIRAFFWEHLYENPIVKTKTDEGAMLITKLCNGLMEHPSPKILALQENTGSTRIEAIKDFVAGMTDAYAQSVATSLKTMS